MSRRRVVRRELPPPERSITSSNQDERYFRFGPAWEFYLEEQQPDGSWRRVVEEPREPSYVTAIDVENGTTTLGRKP